MLEVNVWPHIFTFCNWFLKCFKELYLFVDIAVAEGGVWWWSHCREYWGLPQADTQGAPPATYIPPLCVHRASRCVADTATQRQGKERHTSVS